MTDFDQKQMKTLKRCFTSIAERVGCSRYYVSLVLNNRVTRNTKITREVRETALKLLAILQPKVPERVAGIRSDITVRKTFDISLTETLSKEKILNELNDYFVSMISHEFSAPLATILMSADLLDVYSERMSKNEIAQKIERIKRNAVFLKSIIDNVSDLSLFGRGEMKFSPVDQEVNSFLSEIVQEHLEVCPCTHFISLKKSNLPAYVWIDRSMIKQVIENLLSNSFKYSPEGSTVDVKVSASKNKIIIEIKDQGIGIPEDEADMIFEPFKRGSNVGNIHGTGLGLTLSRHFVRRHGGDITLNTTNSHGTTFMIALPKNMSEV